MRVNARLENNHDAGWCIIDFAFPYAKYGSSFFPQPFSTSFMCYPCHTLDSTVTTVATFECDCAFCRKA
jgi:hypothetical protein